jgi:ribonucleotide monophosphatase NagD (HAD superfamily)
VIAKGPNLIPAAKSALQELHRLNITYVFVSNTCMIEAEKAEQLATMLEVPVSAEQVVLAHTPMRCLKEYHTKHVLVCGQGAVEQIART